MPDNQPRDLSNNETTPPAEPKAPARRQPRRKPAVKKRVDAGVISERRLLDSKIILPKAEPHYRLAKIMLSAMILGGLAGAGILFYLNTMEAVPADSALPQITVPDPAASDAEPEAEASTPPVSPEPPAPPPVQVVEILPTPTNFLNVRRGPGTNFEKIDEVKPGDAYILVSEDTGKGWYEIRLGEDKTGWVTAQYAKVK